MDGCPNRKHVWSVLSEGKGGLGIVQAAEIRALTRLDAHWEHGELNWTKRLWIPDKRANWLGVCAVKRTPAFASDVFFPEHFRHAFLVFN